MSLEGAKQTVRSRIPQLHRAIMGAANDGAAIGAHRHRHHPISMTL